MIRLFHHFSGISFFKPAIREWTATDPMLLELSVFDEAIHAELTGGTLEAVRVVGIDYAQGYAIATPRPFDATFFEHAPAEPRRREVA